MRRRPRLWKLGSLTEITKKLQMCGREQKSKKDQTLWLVHHAQCHSHWCERTTQPNRKCPPHHPNVVYPTSYKKILLLSCWIVRLHLTFSFFFFQAFVSLRLLFIYCSMKSSRKLWLFYFFQPISTHRVLFMDP